MVTRKTNVRHTRHKTGQNLGIHRKIEFAPIPRKHAGDDDLHNSSTYEKASTDTQTELEE